MKGNEQMIFNKDKVPKYGQMDINIQANIIMEKKMVREFIHEIMVVNILENDYQA